MKMGLVFVHGIGPIMIHPHMNKKRYAEINCIVAKVLNGAVQKVSAMFMTRVPKKMVNKHFKPQKNGPMTIAGTYCIKCTMSTSRSIAA